MVNFARVSLSPMATWIEERPWAFLIPVAVLLDVLIGLLDWLTGFEISFSVFYLIPIALVSRCTWKIGAILISVLCAATWLVADLVTLHDYSHPMIPYWNASVRLGFYLIVSLSLVRIRCSVDTLKEMSHTDPLTGVLNPRGFRERAQREIDRAERYGRPFTVAYMDLDNFKAVNDSLGHSAGDELLVGMAEFVTHNIRKTDVPARLGGDEFAVLLSETGSEEAKEVMDRIVEGFSRAMQVQGSPVTLSAGLITFLSPPPSVDEMIQRADDMMYLAKTGGKNALRSGFYPEQACPS